MSKTVQWPWSKDEVLGKLRYNLHCTSMEVQAYLASWLSTGDKAYYEDAYKAREHWRGVAALGIEMGFPYDELIDGATALPLLSKARNLFNEKVGNGDLG